MGHGAVQTLHGVCCALKNPQCHCGIIRFRFNVTNFPRPFALKEGLGLVMKAACAETRNMRAHESPSVGRDHGSHQPVALTQTSGTLGAPYTLRFRCNVAPGQVLTCVLTFSKLLPGDVS